MKPEPKFTGAIIFCSRRDVRDAIREVLKSMGATKVDVVLSAKDCMIKLAENPSFLLVLDWELGPGQVTKVLERSRENYRIETRPILLIANEASMQLISLGYEFAVSQTHIGQISKEKIKQCLKEIVHHEEINAPVKQVLREVSECRIKDDWPKSTLLLKNIKEKLPQNPRIAVELAENHIRQDDWEQVEELLEPFVGISPPYPRVLHLLGRFYMKKGNFVDASAVLTKAKLLSPFNVSRLVDLGNALLNIGRIEEAKENFEEARKIDSKNKNAMAGSGKCLMLEGDINEALLILKDISDPYELASIFNTAAVMAIRSGEFDKAMSLYDSACNTIEDNKKIKAKLVFNKGLAYQRTQDSRSAINMFEESMKLDPDFAKAKRALGRIKKPDMSALDSDATEESKDRVEENVEESSVLEKRKSANDIHTTNDKGLLDFDDGGLEDEFDDESLGFI
ncbi:MAG: tetratricopeptide repeat protein [Bdellovibrionota bacterium]